MPCGFWRRLAPIGLAVVVVLSGLTEARLSGAQSAPDTRRIGILRSVSSEAPDAPPIRANLAALWRGLGEHGFAEGLNARVEYRFPKGAPATMTELRDLARELVDLKVDVIHAAGPPALRAARDVTRTVPIVAHDFETDAVTEGYATSLARPGGNVTGVFLDLPGISSKWLELLRDAVPGLSRVAVLWDPAMPPAQRRAVEDAARTLKLTAQVIEAKGSADFEEAFRRARQAKAEAVLFLSSPTFSGTNSRRLVELTLQHRFPSISLFRVFVESGGLMTYGPSGVDLYRQEGRLVARILKGTSPADLPIERPAQIELIVNRRAARALRLTLTPAILARADRFID
jgi:putative ABC transport system substrate-binding protein